MQTSYWPSPKPLTDYLLIVDRSSSMQSLRDVTISAFNEQLMTIKTNAEKLGQDVRVSFVTFATEVDPAVLWRVPVEKVKPLDRDLYCPCGSTAMLDAIGGAVSKLEQETAIERLEPNSTVVVAIFTDGEENASKKWNAAQVQSLTERLQRTEKWAFTFVGANVDLGRLADRLSIPKTNTRQYVSDVHGTQAILRSMSGDMANYLGKKAAGVGLQELSANYSLTPSDDNRVPNAPQGSSGP